MAAATGYNTRMRNLNTILIAASLAASFLIAGCGGKSVEGTWKMTGAKNMPPGASVMATFGPGDSMKIVMEMPNPAGGEGKFNIAINGTYSLKGDVMDGTAKDVSISVEGIPAEIEKLLVAQFSDEQKKKMLADFNKDSNGSKITWVDDKTFKTKSSDGNEATFEKQ